MEELSRPQSKGRDFIHPPLSVQSSEDGEVPSPAPFPESPDEVETAASSKESISTDGSTRRRKEDLASSMEMNYPGGQVEARMSSGGTSGKMEKQAKSPRGRKSSASDGWKKNRENRATEKISSTTTRRVRTL